MQVRRTRKERRARRAVDAVGEGASRSARRPRVQLRSSRHVPVAAAEMRVQAVEVGRHQAGSVHDDRLACRRRGGAGGAARIGGRDLVGVRLLAREAIRVEEGVRRARVTTAMATKGVGGARSRRACGRPCRSPRPRRRSRRPGPGCPRACRGSARRGRDSVEARAASWG